MKKLLVVGLLVASVTVLARGYNNYWNMYDGQETRIARYQDLTSEQEEKLSVLEKETYKSRNRYMSEMQSKRLDVEKLMLEDKVDWKKIEKSNEDIARLQGKMRTESMRYYKDVSEITGYDYMSGMDGYHMDGAEYNMYDSGHHMSSGGHHMYGDRHHMSGGRW